MRLAPKPVYVVKAGLTRVRSLGWLAQGGREAGGLRILFYHRVSGERDELAVSPSRFAEQMAYLAGAGYRAVDVQTAFESPGLRTVALSFDDGYRDVAEHGLSELERHGFTATVFLATGVTDGRARFAWYEVQPPLLSWEDVGRLDGGVLRFEAHTLTHPNLLTVTDAEAREEIAGSKRELEQQLGRAVEVFCYPAGLYAARHVELVRGAGFRFAVTCEPGANTEATDPLQLHRIQIGPRDSLLDFRAKLAGGHDRPPPGRGLWRRRRYGASSDS